MTHTYIKSVHRHSSAPVPFMKVCLHALCAQTINWLFLQACLWLLRKVSHFSTPHSLLSLVLFLVVFLSVDIFLLFVHSVEVIFYIFLGSLGLFKAVVTRFYLWWHVSKIVAIQLRSMPDFLSPLGISRTILKCLLYWEYLLRIFVGGK